MAPTGYYMVEITVYGQASFGPGQPAVSVSASGPEEDLANILSALENTIKTMSESKGSKMVLNASEYQCSNVPGRLH